MTSYSDRNHKFLFSLPGLKNVESARKEMIRRVYDICVYSLLLGDVESTKRAFGILFRCKEFKWKDLWPLAIYMLNPHDPDRDNTFFLDQVGQLRLLMLQDHTQREELLNEILQVLVQNGRFTEALDEIDLYLPLFPYQNNVVLYTYAGLIRLYMSQDPSSRKENESPDGLLEEAKAALNRVLELDPGNRPAHVFLDLIALIRKHDLTDSDSSLSKDEDSSPIQDRYMIGNAPKRTKRGELVIRQAAMQRYQVISPPPSNERNDD